MIAQGDLVPALIFGAILVIALSALALMPGGSKPGKRVQKITNRFGAKKMAQVTGPSVLTTTTAPGILGQIERTLLQVIPRPAALRLKLARAGIAATPGRFAIVSVGLGVVVAAVVTALGKPIALAVLLGVVAALGLPNIYLSWRIGRRRKRFVMLFPEAVELMVRGLKSGIPVTQTITNVGDEVQDPIGPEFKRVADSAAVGVSLIDALWDTARRLDVAEFRFFVVALTIRRETGGNLAETLENLADILRKRLQMQLKVKALSSEAKSSAVIIGALPFLLFGILMALNPEYVGKLIDDPRGQMMLGVGLFMMSLGAFVMSRMVKFEI